MAGWQVRGGFVGTLAVALLGMTLLVGCGEVPVAGTRVTPPPPLSPQTGQIPEETSRGTAAIKDGKLDPDRFTGQIGTGYQLVVTGDGKEHSLAIGDLVAATPIAASGDTTITFTIGGEPSEVSITLDGKEAGTFQKQSAAGGTSS